MTRPGSRLLAAAMLVGAFALTIASVVFAVLGGAGLQWAVDNFVVSNTLIGASMAAAGWPVATYRPRNPVGWLLLVGGLAYLASAAGLVVLVWAGPDVSHGWVRVVATVVNAGFPIPVALSLPVSLLLLPDGRLPSARWRLVALPAAVGAVGFLASSLVDPAGGLSAEAGARDLIGDVDMGALGGVAAACMVVTYLSAIAALVLRYVRGDQRLRRQLLWIVLAALVLLAGVGVDSFLTQGDTLWGVLPLVFLPVSMTIAVLRHRLLDIEVVVSRSLLYLALTGLVLASYSAVVVMLDSVFRTRVAATPAIAALAIAIAFNPVRSVLQRGIERAVFGARRDPVRALSAVGEQLGSGSGLPEMLAVVCEVLRLPAAAIVVHDRVEAAHGELPATCHRTELRHGDHVLGELVVGLRRGESRVSAADAQVLSLLSVPVAAAVHAAALADELHRSRARIVSGREEERLRLRRDLHDGLGPVLTGVVLNADAARHLLASDPSRSADLLDRLRDQTVGAVADIRRLVHDLRPPVLDGLGLVGALREHAVGINRRLDGHPLRVEITADGGIDTVGAAAEVAAYRIVTEALTNVVRHSTATTVTVHLATSTGVLRLEVHDDGHNDQDWAPGIGLTSMQERVDELGGTSEAHGDPSGGVVVVELPLAAVSS